jgi:nitrite reductase (NADH) large subunit
MIQRTRRPALVVVGTGMAAAKVVEEVLARTADRFHIRMFGAEPHGTYNRILLSQVLSGDATERLWLNPLEWYEERGIAVHAGVKVETIDRERGEVSGANGKVVEPYDLLVLATGSRPFVPPIAGLQQRGVFVFRTLDDCGSIAGYAQECDRAVVLGGGLLGLEAARGLLSHGLEVTVVELAPHLMAQQLDPTGAALLKTKLEALGLEFRLGASAVELLGDGTVEGVKLQDGTILDTDLVVISCGIRPNVEVAKDTGLRVERAIVVDDQMRTSDPSIFAVGECAQHGGKLYGLVDPVYEQARICADVITGARPEAAYAGSRLATTLKVMGIDLTTMGEVHATGHDCEVVSHLDPARGVYKKLVVSDERIVGAILLGEPDHGGALKARFKAGTPLDRPPIEWLTRSIESPDTEKVVDLPDEVQICNCHGVCKGKIVESIRGGCLTIATIGDCTRAGTGCGSCQPVLGQLIDAFAPPEARAAKNKVEVMKEEQNGLDVLPRLLTLADGDRWRDLTEDDKQRAKWHGLFFRKPTPGNFMMRLRLQAGRTNSRQLRVIADLSDEFGKGFCDLTTRQQIQLRWFTLANVPEIWRRLEEVGLHSRQTGMDNVRGVVGCAAAGLTPHELFDATPTLQAFDAMIVNNREFTNLPRKFNVVITGCLENCTHAETQDIALVPARREENGSTALGFNVLVGGKQGSGGYRPATPLDVFVTPDEAAALCAEITRVFRDNGSRETRTRARLAFLIEDRGIGWFRTEVQRRWGRRLPRAGIDARQKHHTDHLGIQAQKPSGNEQFYTVGLLVPVGRITTAQMRGVADLADCYGSGDVRVTVNQNLLIANVPESRLAALQAEPLLRELPHDPSPIMRGLVTCTGNDYCHMALIDTKGWALEVARELEARTEGRKLLPLTMHWSGCAAGCGMHQVATIGFQGCRSRIDGEVVDAAHVYVNGRTGPTPAVASDLMYDVPCDRLADALEPLVCHLPR